MGHSSIQTTLDYYLFNSDANEEKACKALDKMMEEAMEKEEIFISEKGDID